MPRSAFQAVNRGKSENDQWAGRDICCSVDMPIVPYDYLQFINVALVLLF